MRKVFSRQEILEKKIPQRRDFNLVHRKISKMLKNHKKFFSGHDSKPAICGAYAFGSVMDLSYDCRSDLDYLIFANENCDWHKVNESLREIGKFRNVPVQAAIIGCKNGIADLSRHGWSFSEMVKRLLNGVQIVQFEGQLSSPGLNKEADQKSYLNELELLLEDPVYNEAIFLSSISNIHIHFARKILQWAGHPPIFAKSELEESFAQVFPHYNRYFKSCVEDNRVYTEWVASGDFELFSFMNIRLMGQRAMLCKWRDEYYRQIFGEQEEPPIAVTRNQSPVSNDYGYQSYEQKKIAANVYGAKPSY